MIPQEFLKFQHRRLANISIGASALRNQGAPGLVEEARKYFYYHINTEEFISAISNKEAFALYLGYHTVELLNTFPENGKSWGAARKGLNLFFREVVYNKFISEYYQLPTDLNEFNEAIKYLEIPLDRDVANGISKCCKDKLPKWCSIKSLDEDVSNLYQEEAFNIARSKQTARIHLDLEFWRPDSLL